MEDFLAELTGAQRSSIVSRFRKLRPKFAPDGLLSRPGSRVSYDLTRLLSIGAVYSLNSLAIPIGRAVDLVVANWPETVRAVLAARGTPTPGGRADAWGSRLRIYVDALDVAEDGRQLGTASWASAAPEVPNGTSHIVLDCQAIVDALSSVASRDDVPSAAWSAAFAELERTFGWGDPREDAAPVVPDRIDSGFFGTGPYFSRARALVSTPTDTPLGRNDAQRLQAFLDYVVNPAPIDGWKRYIGTEPGQPRLVHMLDAWGHALGLQFRLVPAETIRTAGHPNDERALALIINGERRLDSLRSA